MKSISLCLTIVVAFFTGCNHSDNGSLSSTVIAAGQMPAITKDNTDKLHLVYGKGDSIMYAYSDDKGQSFSSPILVDTLPALVASATRGPQITTVKEGLSIIAADNTGNIFSFTKDQSGEWVKGPRVNDVDTTDKEGFLGLSSDGSNNLFAIWPDLRKDGHNKMYGAASRDGGKTWDKNMMIYTSPDSTVCECCKPSVVMKDNNVYVMFRNFLDGNRDLYLITSADSGNTFGEAQKLGTGNWRLDGCPMDGGGVAVNNNGEVQTVWRREDKIFSDVPGMAEKEIGQGKSSTIETVNGKNMYAWVEDGNVICLFPNGEKQILGKGQQPVLKAINNTQVICVWEYEKAIHRSILEIL
ncbi:MAG: sialidase family protein [Panacibacter sp.]